MGAGQCSAYHHGYFHDAYGSVHPRDREYHATTILCVRKGGKVVLIGDGQVSMGSTIVKPNARKIRRIGEGVVAGFAGSAADGLSLLERLEMKLEEHPGVCCLCCALFGVHACMPFPYSLECMY